VCRECTEGVQSDRECTDSQSVTERECASPREAVAAGTGPVQRRAYTRHRPAEYSQSRVRIERVLIQREERR
jgi:hypothetical protein